MTVINFNLWVWDAQQLQHQDTMTPIYSFGDSVNLSYGA